MTLLLASAPILTAVGLVLLLKQSALRAGLAGLLIALALVFLVPSFDLEGASLWRSLARGLLITGSVAYILLGGVLLYQVLRAGGALDSLSRSVARAIPDEGHRLLSLVFGLSVFFESATGFGVGIIVTAPLLMALGYDPIRAGLLALLGQCAVSWGALAIGTVLGAELSAVPSGDLGLWAAVLGFPYVVASGALALKIAGAWRPLAPRALLLLLYSLLLSLALAVFSIAVGVELAGCLAGLVVVTFGLLAGGRRTATEAGVRDPRLAAALLPFAFLLVCLLLTRLVPGLKSWLSALLLVDLPDLAFTLSPLYHPGFWLLAAALVGVVVLRLERRALGGVLVAALGQWWVASLAVAGFLCLSQVMVEAGMIARLAEALASGAGAAYPAFMPLIGGLGGFLTASNAASNALFMQFQISVAAQGGLPIELTAATQNAAGSNMTFISPGRLVLAAAVIERPGSEPLLLRRLLPLGLFGLLGTAAIVCGVIWL